MMTIVDGARARGAAAIAIVEVARRELAWTLDGKGAARGTTERAGIMIEARTSEGLVGRGEASPLPGMSRETLADVRAELDAFAARMPMAIASNEDVFALAQSVSSPAARFAIETALLDALARSRGITIAQLFTASNETPDDDSALAAADRLRAAVTVEVVTPDAFAEHSPLAAAVDRMRAIVAGDPAVTLEVVRARPAALDTKPAAPARTATGRDAPAAPSLEAFAAPAVSRVVDTVADALAAIRDGARCLKIKLGDRELDDDVTHVRAIAAAAPHATLRLDANRRWPRADAIAHLARFADIPALEYIEEPCAGAHELLRDALPVRIALDESLAELTTDQIFGALESPHLGALVLKPTLLGGFSPCIALASLARLANKPAIVTHTLESPIGQAACRELARIVGGSHAHGVLPGTRALDPSGGFSHEVALGDSQAHGVLPDDRALDVPGGLAQARGVSFGDAAHALSPSNGAHRSASTVEGSRGTPHVHVATPELETVATVWAALDQRSPIALIHHALPADEIARRREQLTAHRVFAGLQRSPVGSLFGEMSRPSRPSRHVAEKGPDTGASQVRGTASTMAGNRTSEIARSGTMRVELDTRRDTANERGTVSTTGVPAAASETASGAELDPAVTGASPVRGTASTTGVPGDAAVVLFTSGSTAEARGVVLSRAAVEAAAAASAEHLGWRDDDCWFVPLSLAHAGGLAAVVRCWFANKPIALLDRNWDRGRAAALLERCTLASLVPTQLADLLSDPAWRPPARLRAVLLGGAAASRPLLEQAAARGVPFLTTYGMTESFGQLATAPLDRAGDPDAPLVPLPGVELSGGTREAPAPIRVRAPMLATRYLDGVPIAPDFTTRDLGYMEDGALVIVGRVDDVIITGGENVHPATVEAVLAATPGVGAAIAFAIPDDKWGQIVGAAIATERDLDPEMLAAWRAALPAHARPRELAIVRALPVLATGKLDRRAAAQLPRSPIRYG